MARDIATRVRAFTLFATHYFELTTLASEVEGCANVHLDATEHGDGIVFLHAVKDGPANRSYGLQVAQLAGVPREVIAEARRYLEHLEAERDRHRARAARRRRRAPRRRSCRCLRRPAPQRAPRRAARRMRCARRSPRIDPDELSPESGARGAVRPAPSARSIAPVSALRVNAARSAPAVRNSPVSCATRADNSMPRWLTGSTMWSVGPGHARLAHRDGAVVVLVEVGEQLPDAERLSAGDDPQRPRVRPAPLARLQQLLAPPTAP